MACPDPDPADAVACSLLATLHFTYLRGNRPRFDWRVLVATSPSELHIVGFLAFSAPAPLVANQHRCVRTPVGFKRWKALHRLAYVSAVLGRLPLHLERQDRRARADRLGSPARTALLSGSSSGPDAAKAAVRPFAVGIRQPDCTGTPPSPVYGRDWSASGREPKGARRGQPATLHSYQPGVLAADRAASAGATPSSFRSRSERRRYPARSRGEDRSRHMPRTRSTSWSGFGQASSR